MFEARCAMLGFDKTGLDDGNRWATSLALEDFTPAVKKRIEQLVKVAGG